MIFQVDLSSAGFEAQAGDMMGFTWTNAGVIPFDYTSGTQYYYEDSINPTEGSSVTLTANRHGNR